MPQLLIVSPNFPPVSAADMHRVRMSLPHFSRFGWTPSVLAVGGTEERVLEPDLLASVPADVPVVYAGAVPAGMTRIVGVGNLALRAFGHLYRAGLRLIRSRRVDLVYFSTTMFPAMALGRLWKARTGVPFVLDMQDPWVSDYLEAHSEARPPKYALARRLHRVLEPFTMHAVDGVIAVSPGYCSTLRQRYPRIGEAMCTTIPFGAAEEDMRLASRLDWRNPWFAARTGGPLNVVSVGRGGRDMEPAARILFRAMRLLEQAGDVAPTAMWFIGTDYAPGEAGRQTLAPLAALEGLTSSAVESPARLPYLQALRVLQEADLLVVLGSEDAQYAPSKVYPYLLAGRPVVAVMHEDSPVVGLLRRAGAGPVVTFRDAEDVDRAAQALAPSLVGLLGARPAQVDIDADITGPWLAPELTRQQCEFFDRVVAGDRAGH